ncbi:phosphomevalonate kinase [Clostridium sp. 19966]|uniref:phosphomevalonate kinase n=1 Tax=Clostridium sp. 19966 TaxID=2768166 RepID=UPI0028E03115|nr:phosphomevalonate kinase [Clostridium sp. 19966]MDT8719296.1 phosphomevalonate kinase [Clostridium sp. 19966]
MNCSSYNIKVPGKLMIAGEYAVLEPNHKAVVIAVNRYIHAIIEPSEKNRIFIPQLGLMNIAWEINDGKVKFNVDDCRLNFIANSISAVHQYLEEQMVKPMPFKIMIRSELDDPSTGKKYGLGSSAAIVVSVVTAILRLNRRKNEAPSLDEIFKLSAIAHIKTQNTGSGADIAASVYGGWLQYSAFSVDWITSELEQQKKLIAIVNQKWPNLLILPITSPKELQLVVGWTKSAISTAPMIKNVHDFKAENLEAYNDFLIESSAAVNRMLRSFKINDCAGAIISLTENRNALKRLGERSNINIETAALRALCNAAERFGSGKSSGAGGGDCGIAFLNGYKHAEELLNVWEKEGILPLDLQVSRSGASIKHI